jgi:hypothetical protein
MKDRARKALVIGKGSAGGGRASDQVAAGDG